MMPELPSDFPLRGGLLPEGCKDLLDVIRQKEREGKETTSAIVAELLEALKKEVAQGKMAMGTLANLPVPGSVIEIGPEITVMDLAAKVGRKPFQIMAVLITMQVFVTNMTKTIEFEVAEKIARQFGFEVRRVE